jgi:hypothetical protein
VVHVFSCLDLALARLYDLIATASKAAIDLASGLWSCARINLVSGNCNSAENF